MGRPSPGRLRGWLRRLAHGLPRRPARKRSPGPDDGIHLSLETLLGLRTQVRGLALTPRRASRARVAGAERAAFRGRGLDFDELRDYQPGDDARSIDWRVTARTGRPHTRVYREERERPVWLVVDLRPGMFFATRGAFKSVQAGKAAGLLAWAAAERGDRVGALLFTDSRYRELTPRGGQRGVLPILRALADSHVAPERMAAPTSLAVILARLRRIARPGSLIVLLSDFQGLDYQSEEHLSRLARRHDLTAVQVYDPLETEPPAPGRYPVSDGVEVAFLDTTRARVREALREHFSAHQRRVADVFTRRHVHVLRLATHNAVWDSVQRVLQARVRTRRSAPSSRAGAP